MSAADWLIDPTKGIARTVRPAQVRMATIVEKVLEQRGIAMIEAGTGTGKSFAYLVPALLSGKRVVVSTGKKTLQKQLRDNDVPFLLEKLGLTATYRYASLKGKNNYACRLRMETFEGSDESARIPQEDLDAFQSWVATDELGELDDYKNIEFGQHIRVTECVAKKCDSAPVCGYRRARDRAQVASLVIVNHALLAFDLAMGGGRLFGKYDAVVLDEAHEAARFFREAHTCRIHQKQPDALRKLLADTGLRIPEGLDQNVITLLTTLPERGRIIPNHHTVDAALGVHRNLAILKQAFMTAGAWSEPGESDADDDDGRDAAESARLRAAATITQRMLKACEVCIDKLDLKVDENGRDQLTPQDYVMFVETSRSRGEAHKEFVATPIEVGPLVAPALKGVGTVIFTSATLSTGGTFDYACREFGLRSDEVTLKEIMPATFNYRANSCLYVSPTTPEYKREFRQAYWKACSQEMHELMTASKGGAFVLCASYEDMNAFHDLLYPMVRNYELRAQSGNVDTLVAWFKESPRRVILGVKSIWEGVDIPGLGLRLVVIPRLPFPNPDDPVFTARKAKYVTARIRMGSEQRVADMQAWNLYDLQEAILAVKQGGGRLIRRETDKGVVAILDRRAHTNFKRYSSTVRGSLPHPLTYSLEDVKGFLGGLAAQV